MNKPIDVPLDRDECDSESRGYEVRVGASGQLGDVCIPCV